MMADNFRDPQSRNEALLQNLLGADNSIGEPQSPNEAILQNMLGAENELREPQSVIEDLLIKVNDTLILDNADTTRY